MTNPYGRFVIYARARGQYPTAMHRNFETIHRNCGAGAGEQGHAIMHSVSIGCARQRAAQAKGGDGHEIPGAVCASVVRIL